LNRKFDLEFGPFRRFDCSKRERSKSIPSRILALLMPRLRDNEHLAENK